MGKKIANPGSSLLCVILPLDEWNQGAKSQLGHMKTLLCSVLKQNPQLIPVVFPTQWSARYSTKLGDSSAVC
jgi:hypothetical protein